MHVATIGSDPVLARRRQLLGSMDGVDLADEIDPGNQGALQGVDVLFVGVPRADRFQIASQAARSGTHIFLEWPPATSIRECSALVRLAEEGGLECGVSRPFRFCPLLSSVGGDWRANTVSLTLRGDVHVLEDGASQIAYPRLSRVMADAVDLSCALVGSSSVRRVDAEAARDESLQPSATLFSLRFHSGAYAQVFIRLNGTTAKPTVFASGNGVHLEGTVTELGEGLHHETSAFLTALTEGRPVPVTALDALHTMRIVERLQGLLR